MKNKIKKIKDFLKNLKPRKKVVKRNPGLYAELKNKHLSHNNVTKEEFLERENQSYGMDLGGDCGIYYSEMRKNIK